MSEQKSDKTLLSIITPAYNESANLALLHAALSAALDPSGQPWEWVIVDDHSADGTFEKIRQMAQQDPRIVGIRLARNSGSHTAIACAMHHARGDCAVVMAADLQDPPDTIPLLLEKWRAGNQVVWAAREQREGEKLSVTGFSRLYYFIMRHIVGLKELPATGADFFLIDRAVLDAADRFTEQHVNIFALITWMGFRQTTIHYAKQARIHGASGWNFEKKIKLVVDSITSFTYLPIRLMSYGGIGAAFLGFLYALFVIIHALRGSPVSGWSSLMVVVLVMGGLQMIMMGILGEYLWRALDESRRRPRFIIEETVGRDPREASR